MVWTTVLAPDIIGSMEEWQTPSGCCMLVGVSGEERANGEN